MSQYLSFIYNDGKDELRVPYSVVEKEMAELARTRPYLSHDQIVEAMNDLEYWLCRADGFDYWEDENEEEIGPYDRVKYNTRTGYYEYPNPFGEQRNIPRQTFDNEIQLIMVQYNLDRETAVKFVLDTSYWSKRHNQAIEKDDTINSWNAFLKWLHNDIAAKQPIVP